MVKLRTEIKGNVYGHLLALGEHKRGGAGNRIMELCRCLKCGYEHYVDRASLFLGRGGCRQCSHLKHGLSRDRFYKIYIGITQRCTNIKDESYKIYGGRGIKCEWNNFEEFKNDMYESYLEHIRQYGVKQTTIDRIDFNGNYCKDNCRRATYKEQGRNTSKYKGIVGFCEDNGVDYGKLHYQLYFKNKTLDEVFEMFKKK